MSSATLISSYCFVPMSSANARNTAVFAGCTRDRTNSILCPGSARDFPLASRERRIGTDHDTHSDSEWKHVEKADGLDGCLLDIDDNHRGAGDNAPPACARSRSTARHARDSLTESIIRLDTRSGYRLLFSDCILLGRAAGKTNTGPCHAARSPGVRSWNHRLDRCGDRRWLGARTVSRQFAARHGGRPRGQRSNLQDVYGLGGGEHQCGIRADFRRYHRRVRGAAAKRTLLADRRHSRPARRRRFVAQYSGRPSDHGWARRARSGGSTRTVVRLGGYRFAQDDVEVLTILSESTARDPVSGAFRTVALRVRCIGFEFECSAGADMLGVAAYGEPHLAAYDQGFGGECMYVGIDDLERPIFPLQNSIETLCS